MFAIVIDLNTCQCRKYLRKMRMGRKKGQMEAVTEEIDNKGIWFACITLMLGLFFLCSRLRVFRSIEPACVPVSGQLKHYAQS